MFKRGDQIAYVPLHAEGDLKHPDVEFGFVTSGPNWKGDYFCRYWAKGHLGTLRTKLNSELTPIDRIVAYESVPQEEVARALQEHC